MYIEEKNARPTVCDEAKGVFINHDNDAPNLARKSKRRQRIAKKASFDDPTRTRKIAKRFVTLQRREDYPSMRNRRS